MSSVIVMAVLMRSVVLIYNANNPVFPGQYRINATLYRLSDFTRFSGTFASCCMLAPRFFH